ncbi:hypothetical protein DL240_12345 [Lujinxingia litoralis]|uniref:HEAT repeat domain-containing protein n=1 Tax=Lujinxingia litoralis TaxID=2211119 RepID=A0A328C9J5_9DELT|nr:HEAT repeat domain-containing protein [Lujinxingia litoralis]RAL21640.1 hypothetical protein DL240_12345 [Lujinxingia litoralis]
MKRAKKGIGVLVAGLVMSAGGVLGMPAAWAEGGNVRYSYEEVRLADQRDYVLVPRAEGSLSGEVTRKTIEQAFEALRRAKRPTYGNSYAEVSGQVPDRAQVQVHIDSNKADYAIVIIAEVVYTLTEFGVPAVSFPGYADRPLTRADVPFAAYTLNVPLWKVLPPGRLSSGQVIMPDGELVPMEQVQEQWRANRSELLDELYAYLGASQPFTVFSTVKMLPSVGDLRLDQVLPLLGHESRDVRQATLGILDGVSGQEPVLTAVAEAMADERSASLARAMAEFLGKSNQARFNVQEQFFLLRRGQAEEKLAAAEALGDRPGDERVLDALAQALRSETEALAMKAADSLEKLSGHPVRVAALTDEAVAAAVRLKLADDLSASAKPAAVRLAGLRYIAEHRSEGHINQALNEVARLGTDQGREALEGYLGDALARRRSAATEALVLQNDVASVAVLSARAEDASGAEQERLAQAAYAIMVNQSPEVVLEQTQVRDVKVQRVAYEALGERATRQGGAPSSEVLARLEEGSKHRDNAIRGAAARALGAVGGERALQRLSEMSGDRSPQVRRSVALALGQAPATQQIDTLMGYLDDSDPQVVAAAVDAFGMREDPRAIERIRPMASHESAAVRAAALRALTSFAQGSDTETVRQHVGLLGGAVNDPAREVKLTALTQLGRFELGIAVTNIALQVSAEDPELRATAVRALGDTGHASAQPLVETALRDGSSQVRREAILAMAKLPGNTPKTRLQARLEAEEDPQLKELIRTTLQEI